MFLWTFNWLKTPRQRWFSADGVCFVSLFFTVKYLLGEEMAFKVVLRNFSECNGLKFYIPEISQNSCYHKISWAYKKYHPVWTLQRIFSQTKSRKSLNIMVPGAGGGRQAALAVQSLSNASLPGRVTQGNPPKYTLRGAKIKAASFWDAVHA